MNTCLNRGRLRRPGRGLKTTNINQSPIQKTASHTEFLTLPLPTHLNSCIEELLRHVWQEPARA